MTRARFVALVAMIVATSIVFSVLIPNYLSANSLINVLRQSSVIAIVSLGATFVIVSGEIDLSLGSVVALVAVLTAWVSRLGLSVAPMLVAAALAGMAIGTLNGLVVLKLRVPSFLATLGTMSIASGAAMTLSLQPIPVRSLSFVNFFGWSVIGIPMPVVIAIILVAGAASVTRKSRYFIRLRATGSNENAARLAGIATLRQKYSALLIGSVFAAAGGVVLAGKTNYGIAQSGAGMELDAIAAVILGGGRLGGGAGTIIGTTLGALLLTMIFAGIATVGLSGPYQDIAKGLAIALAILLTRR